MPEGNGFLAGPPALGTGSRSELRRLAVGRAGALGHALAGTAMLGLQFGAMACGSSTIAFHGALLHAVPFSSSVSVPCCPGLQVFL